MLTMFAPISRTFFRSILNGKIRTLLIKACQDLHINISRSAVARIRTGGEGQPSLPTKAEFFDMAKEAEALEFK